MDEYTGWLIPTVAKPAAEDLMDQIRDRCKQRSGAGGFHANELTL